jgi:ABC-type antimicrobial peptide transport system permease subunit
MIKNNIKTALRNLSKNKSYAIINITGLSVGIAICIMIFIIIQFHGSFDNFHAKKDRIYRVLTEYHHADSKEFFYGAGVPHALPGQLKTAFPQLEQVVPVLADDNDQVVIPGSGGEAQAKFKEEKGVLFTTPSFFSIFDFRLLQGSYETLKDPNHVLLTKETAEKYFGDWKAAMGRTIKINNTDELTVTGILASIPVNTDFQLKMAVAYGTGGSKNFLNSTDWDGTSSDFGCYILLPPNMSAPVLNKQLIAYSKKVKSADNKDVQTIQALKDVHYDTQTGNFSNKTISHSLINAMWLIAAFILLIACVNFINLSTALAVNRAKEVGVRKVLGSNKQQLKFQFLAETFMIVLASLVLALFISWAAIPYINGILELNLSVSRINILSIALFLAAISAVVTMLAGFYPSVVLSRFNPVTALKSRFAAKNTKGISLRRGLVIFQFITAQCLIIGTLVIVKQMDYFSSQPVGFDKTAVVNVPVPTDSASNSKIDYLAKQLKDVAGIESVSFNSNSPIENNNDNWTMFNFDRSSKRVEFYSIIKSADNEYLPTYKLPLIAGRNITASDTLKEFLVNRMVLKNLGIANPQDALNKEIKFTERTKGLIVGVLEDFNTRSFRDGMAPLLIASSKQDYDQASIKLAAGNITAVLKKAEKIWNSTYPDFVFEYKFLDDKVESFYKQEQQLSHLYRLFAIVAILLSCLGLYGLASFMAAQRIKEVGIRKVNGATIFNIVYLFSKEFVVLIAIAFVIATPVAWYFMHQWLQNYPFKINLSWWIFLAGGLTSVLIALATVSYQALKAAMANPVKSLRSE